MAQATPVKTKQPKKGKKGVFSYVQWSWNLDLTPILLRKK
jgi:hypothetical protein